MTQKQITMKITDNRDVGGRHGVAMVQVDGREIFSLEFNWPSSDGRLPVQAANKLLPVLDKYGSVIEFIGGRCEVREDFTGRSVWWIKG